MDKALLDLVISTFEEESGEIDMWSEEYFFNKKYAEFRSNVVTLGGPTMRRSRLSLLIREGMTEGRRAKIFPSHFDLGNTQPVPSKLCTYEKLAIELYGDEGDRIAANDAFETIKNGIHRITGKKMHEHFKVNKSTALKVIKLLDTLVRRREPRLMQLLMPPVPKKKFSMSFRDAYPYERNQEQVWLIADLKAYLSAELSDSRFQEIGITFSSVHGVMNNIVRNVEKIFVDAYCTDYSSLLSAYDGLTEAAADFQTQKKQKDVPLDEELFIYLHGLEFAHFAVGYPQLIEKALPQLLITPVHAELRALTNDAFPTVYVKVSEYDPLLSIKDVPAFSLRWQKRITGIMERAMGAVVASHELDQLTCDVQNLLRCFYFSLSNNGQVLDEDTKSVSPWHVVAAFCCIWHTLKLSTNFKPYWLAQPSQSGSVGASIKKPFKLPNKLSLSNADFAIDSVPEEHRHLWTLHLEWFADALRGHIALRERRFAFRAALVGKMLAICQVNDTDCIAHQIVNFVDYIKIRAIRSGKAS